MFIPPLPVPIPSQARLLAAFPARGETPWETHLFAWSPDAESLAYVGPETSYTHTLMLAAAPRFDAPQLLASGVMGDLFWSPDGSRIAFVAFRSDDLETVMTIAADGSDLRDWFSGELAQTDAGSGSKAIGGWLDSHRLWGMTNCGTGCRSLWQLDLRNGALTQLFPYQESADAPFVVGTDYVWSPDQTHAAFISGIYQIGVQDIAGRSVQWVSEPGQVCAPFVDWAADSSSFIYLSQDYDENGVPLAPPSLWRWDVDVAQRFELLPGVATAAWSPDGDGIAFVALGQPHVGPDGDWQGVTASLDGPNPLGIGLYRQRENKVMAFAPIGETDLGYRWPDQLYQRLLRPVWAPDGVQFAYRDGAGKAWVFSAENLTRYELDIADGPVAGLRWSPDGGKLAVSTADSLLVFFLSR